MGAIFAWVCAGLCVLVGLGICTTGRLWRRSSAPKAPREERAPEEHAHEVEAEIERRVAARTKSLEQDIGRLARASAERHLAEVRAILESLTEGVLIADAAGNMLDVNRAGLEMLGFRDLDEVRRPFRELDELFEVSAIDGTPVPIDTWPMARALREERFTNEEQLIRRKDTGRSIFGSYSGTPVYDASGKCVVAIVTVRDVTAKKRAERERELLLESERAARSEAERASRVKDEFVATVSHELRTPLTAILGFTHLLRANTPSPEKLERGLGTIERNGRLLGQIIADLLDVSRIVSGKLHIEVSEVDLAAVARSALDGIKAAAEAKGVELKASIAPGALRLRGDPARLEQVAGNLLSNAVKFTPRGGQVELQIERAGSRVRLAVADTGQGIDRAFLPHVFDRFRQADASATRKHGGLGIGLSLVKHIVELHGGAARAESEGEGKGARFLVELPLAAETEGAALSPDPRVEAPRLDGLRVLVVEDDPDTRELLRKLLEESKAEVRTAASAPEALSLLEAEKPDVLISDLGMPGMDGLALIREIRAGRAPGAEAVPAVALTAFARPEDRSRALVAGYEAHLPKPIEPLVLVSTVAGLSGRRGAAARSETSA